MLVSQYTKPKLFLLNKQHYLFNNSNQNLVVSQKRLLRLGGGVQVASPPVEKLIEHDLVEEATEVEEKKVEFNWTKQWYPLLVIENLDPDRPTPAQLLGMDLVVWRDGEQNWHCFEDKCPHRFVPLSEGRIETDGTLQCAYHAWRFNGKGECTLIPQADPKQAQQQCSNKRAQCTAFPTMEKFGILWVWAESGADAFLESLNHQPKYPKELDSIKNFKNKWSFTKLPYSYDMFCENISDPAHVPVSHHGTMFGNREDAQFQEFEMTSKASVEGWTRYRHALDTDNDNQGKIKKKATELPFIAPNSLTPITHYENGWSNHVFLLVSPTNIQTSTLIGFITKFDAKGEEQPPPSFPAGFLWLQHYFGALFLQQDTVFLYGQMKYLMKNNVEKPYTKSYYSILASDIGVNEFYKWVQEFGGGGVPYVGEQKFIPLSQSELENNYEMHTKHCKACLSALENFKKSRVFTWFACALLAMKSVCGFSYGNPTEVFLFGKQFVVPAVSGFVFGLGAAVFAFISQKISSIIEGFYKIQYKHADH